MRADRVGSIEAEHGDERLVYGPHFVGCELSGATPEPLGIYGADLFDENPSRYPSNRNLGSERRWTSAS